MLSWDRRCLSFFHWTQPKPYQSSMRDLNQILTEPMMTRMSKPQFGKTLVRRTFIKVLIIEASILKIMRRKDNRLRAIWVKLNILTNNVIKIKTLIKLKVEANNQNTIVLTPHLNPYVFILLQTSKHQKLNRIILLIWDRKNFLRDLMLYLRWGFWWMINTFRKWVYSYCMKVLELLLKETQRNIKWDLLWNY